MNTQTPVSPFASGPYTDVQAPVDPRTQADTPEAPGTGIAAFLKVTLFVLFIALGINPSAFGWVAGVIAGLFMGYWAIKLTAWYIRKVREL